MLIAPSFHLGHELFVALEECPCLANPAPRFGMPRVPARGVVDYQDVPESVQFPMLTEQMLPAESSG